MNDERTSKEYNDERNMEHFWSVANNLKKEPLRQKWFLPVLIAFIVISIPWYRTAGESGSIVGGLPVWIWVSLASALGVSIVTAVGILLFWKDSDDE